jgi:hypothetical protein
MAKSRRSWNGFVSETIDYGTITHRWTTRICFNNGTKPLIITNTQGSCGCTVPTSQNQLLRGKRYYWCKMLLTELDVH